MDTSLITDREKYLALFPSQREAVEFEQSILQAGREFLPAPALLVLDGVTPTPDYWRFLAEQWAEVRE